MVMLDEWSPRPAVAFPCQQAGTGTDLEQDGIQRYFEHWLLSAKNGSGRLLPAFGFARVAAHGLSPANVQQQSHTKAANENGQVYAADLEDLRTRLDELIVIGREILSRLADL
jgi:hypothetical protein